MTGGSGGEGEVLEGGAFPPVELGDFIFSYTPTHEMGTQAQRYEEVADMRL